MGFSLYDKYRIFHEIDKHEAGSTLFRLKGDCRKDFDISGSSVMVQRDEGCLEWLVEEAVRKSDSDKPRCIVEEIAYAFPYTLIPAPIMKKVNTAVELADNNHPRQIWECIKLANLDQYVSNATKAQQAKHMITSKSSLIHEYRSTYNASHRTDSANADAYQNDECIGTKGGRKMEDKHSRRFVLSAETQIGKTGAYCWFLKLLSDEIHGEELPEIPSKSVLLEPVAGEQPVTMADKVKWMVPYWKDISRSSDASKWLLKILPGKYHRKVKLQRLRLLLSILRSSDENSWQEKLIDSLKGMSGDGECIQTEFHSKKLDALKTTLAEKPKPPLILHSNAFEFRKPVADSKKILEIIVDWDCVDSNNCSV
jgi:hypothetical protein